MRRPLRGRRGRSSSQKGEGDPTGREVLSSPDVSYHWFISSTNEAKLILL